jgi:hypothetical protein
VGPAIVHGAINPLCELLDEFLGALEAYRRTVLQCVSEVELTVTRSRLVRDLHTRRVILAGTKEPPEPAKLGGRGCGGGTRGSQRECVGGEAVGRDRGEGEVIGARMTCRRGEMLA